MVCDSDYHIASVSNCRLLAIMSLLSMKSCYASIQITAAAIAIGFSAAPT